MSNRKQNQYLIVGASSDIGSEIIRNLDKRNSDTKILAVSRSNFDYKTANLSPNHTYLNGLDLTQDSAVEEIGKAASNFFDEPFTVIHSVGEFWYHKPLVKTSFLEARKMIESHYLTLFGVVHAILPLQQKLGGGKIIAFSCNSVGYHYPDMAAFTSAKAAIESLIKCIANEYSRDNIVANAIALSTIRTDKVEKSKNPKYFDGYITSEELAQLALDAIAELSPLVNGNVIRLLKYSKYFYTEGYYQRNPSQSSSEQP